MKDLYYREFTLLIFTNDFIFVKICENILIIIIVVQKMLELKNKQKIPFTIFLTRPYLDYLLPL